MKKRIKRGFWFCLILVMILYVFKTPIYGFSVKYKDIGSGATAYQLTNDSLKKYIDTQLPSEKMSDIHIMMKKSQQITADILSFDINTKETNPNQLFIGKKANCVGYANMNASIINYMMHKMYEDASWQAEARRAKLLLFGIDVHQFIDNRSYSNHDYVRIRNKETDTEYYIDPTVFDYLGINTVSKR